MKTTWETVERALEVSGAKCPVFAGETSQELAVFGDPAEAGVLFSYDCA